MDIQQTSVELQKFSDANGLNIDAGTVLSSMDAGDYIELNTAMDQSDNRSIMKILQKYKARLSENYKFFSGKKLIENESMKHFATMGVDELFEHYHQYVTGALEDGTHYLTLAEMQTLVYEDLTTSLNANQIAARNTSVQQQKVNPQTQMKMKQAQIQRNSNNQNFKVSVPGNQNGTTDVENVVGIDAGPTPQTSLVVTKDPNRANELNVYGLNDVDPVNNGSQVNIQEADDDVMGPADNDHLEQTSSPLTHSAPSMGELMQTIGDIEGQEDIHGEDSVEGNEAMHNQDEVISQIIDFCSRLQRK